MGESAGRDFINGLPPKPGDDRKQGAKQGVRAQGAADRSPGESPGNRVRGSSTRRAIGRPSSVVTASRKSSWRGADIAEKHNA